MPHPHLTAEQLLRSLTAAEPTDASLRELLDTAFKQHPKDDEAEEPED